MHPQVKNQNSRIKMLVETSWEVCNKIGGIYTVLSTKARVLQEKYGDKLLFIGPDVLKKSNNIYFQEDFTLFQSYMIQCKLPYGIKIRSGRWNIPGSPQVLLLNFDGIYEELDRFFGEMWDKYGVDSLKEYGDYREGCAFSIASAIVIKDLASYLNIKGKNVTAHFNEWTTGMGLLYLETILPEAATIFTTHATSIGRSICGNGKPLYDYFYGYNGDQMAGELNMEAKHSLEKKAAFFADCFTAVSEITAKECEQLLEKRPDIVTPNGFEPDFVPSERKYKVLRNKGRDKVIKIAESLKNKTFEKNVFIVATSGRNEYRNKGLDIFLDSLKELDKYSGDREIIALVLVPAWVKEPSYPLLESLEKNKNEKIYPDYLTHRLNNENEDSIACRIRNLEEEHSIGKNVNVIFVPCYLDGGDGIFNISYYDLLPAIDLTIFPSYYEPWGYTPLESIAFGVPTITSDKSGFGQWIIDNYSNNIFESGVEVISRTDSNYSDFAKETAKIVNEYILLPEKEKKAVSKRSVLTSHNADWKYFIKFYNKAYEIAGQKRNLRNNK